MTQCHILVTNNAAGSLFLLRHHMLRVSIIDMGLQTTNRTGRHAFWRNFFLLVLFYKDVQGSNSRSLFYVQEY